MASEFVGKSIFYSRCFFTNVVEPNVCNVIRQIKFLIDLKRPFVKFFWSDRTKQNLQRKN